MALILCPQASGKTFASKTGKCIDLEQVLSFNAETLKCSTSSSSSSSSNEFDLSHYWMRHVLQGVLACLSLRRVCLVNFVSPHNALLVNLVVRGLAGAGHAVQVVLPEEEVVEERLLMRREKKHFDDDKRPTIRFQRGNALHVASCRLMMAGIASQNPNVVSVAKEIHIPEHVEQPKLDMRFFKFDIGKKKHMLVEYVPGCFVECVDDFPELFLRMAGDGVLVCDKGTKKCTSQHGFSCSFEFRVSDSIVSAFSNRELLGSFPVIEQSVKSFIPTQKLNTRIDAEKEIVVLALFGSFAPIHSGHLEMLSLAKEFFERDGSRIVAGAYISPILSVARKKHMVEPLQSWYTRAAIAHHVVASHPFAMVDPTISLYSSEWERHPIHSLADRVAHAFPGRSVTTVWVNGSDASYARITEQSLRASPRPIRLFVVPPRPGQQDRFAESGLSVCNNVIFRGDLPQQLDISSTAIRALVLDGQFKKATQLIGQDLATAIVIFAFQENERIEEETQKMQEAKQAMKTEEKKKKK